jgi:hypothetical protein
MRKVEAVRLRHGMTKKAVATEIGTAKDVLRSWLSGESIGRKERAIYLAPGVINPTDQPEFL